MTSKRVLLVMGLSFLFSFSKEELYTSLQYLLYCRQFEPELWEISC
jgi:hypothetical protein